MEFKYTYYNDIILIITAKTSSLKAREWLKFHFLWLMQSKQTWLSQHFFFKKNKSLQINLPEGQWVREDETPMSFPSRITSLPVRYSLPSEI